MNARQQSILLPRLYIFTVVDKDYARLPSVYEYHISNPDVGYHNSYATFRINGKDIDGIITY